MVPKFNFVPEKQLQEGYSEYTPAKVSLYATENGINMVFPTETVKIYDLGGKWIRMYGDRPNRTIGWSIIDTYTSPEIMNECRELKVGQNGNIQIGVKKLLKSIGVEFTKSLSGLSVKKHISPLHEHEVYYIEIPREVKDLYKNPPTEVGIETTRSDFSGRAKPIL